MLIFISCFWCDIWFVIFSSLTSTYFLLHKNVQLAGKISMFNGTYLEDFEKYLGYLSVL